MVDIAESSQQAPFWAYIARRLVVQSCFQLVSSSVPSPRASASPVYIKSFVHCSTLPRSSVLHFPACSRTRGIGVACYMAWDPGSCCSYDCGRSSLCVYPDCQGGEEFASHGLVFRSSGHVLAPRPLCSSLVDYSCAMLH